MSDITIYTEKLPVKRVYYTGSDRLKGGYALCYDRDTITAKARGPGFHLGSTALDQGAALTAGYESWGRHSWVEKPAAGNLHNFAGVVSPSYDGVTGPAWIDIVEPDAIGRVVPLFTEESCTYVSTILTVKPGSYVFGGQGEGLAVALALQTIDRSSTNGLAQALLLPNKATGVSQNQHSALGRASTAMPTAAIWDNFPLADMRLNPFLGTLFETDFKGNNAHFPTETFIDATERIDFTGVAIGELEFFATTNNQGAEAQWNCPIDVAGGQPWAMEFRVKASTVGDSLAGFFIGLFLQEDAMAGDQISDAGALDDGGAIGFQRKEADGDKIDFIYDEASQSQNEHDDDYVTPAANTYNTLGMYYNGSTIQGYVDGVATGTAISATDIAAADFPTAAILLPSVFLKNADDADFTLTLDWMRVAQAP